MTSIVGRIGKAQIAIISIIPEEHDALKRLGVFELFVPTKPYMYRTEIDIADGKKGYDVILARTRESGTHSCRETVSEVIEALRPDFIILCGVAGGIDGRWGANLGNVIISNYVEGYEEQKLTHGSKLQQKKALDHPSQFIRDIAETVRVKNEWIDNLDVERPEVGVPEIHEGNIISGEKLMGDETNAYQRSILEAHMNASAVDMESYGLARAAFNARSTIHYNLHYLVIRGISDLVLSADEPVENTENNQEMRNKWRKYASTTAAAVTLAVIESLLPGDWADSRVEEQEGNV